MRNSLFARGCLAVALLAMPRAALAQTPDLAAIQQQIDQLKQQLQALQDQLAKLGAQPPSSPSTVPPQPAPAAATPEQTATVPAGAEGGGGPSETLPVYGAGAAS